MGLEKTAPNLHVMTGLISGNKPLESETDDSVGMVGARLCSAEGGKKKKRQPKYQTQKTTDDKLLAEKYARLGGGGGGWGGGGGGGGSSMVFSHSPSKHRLKLYCP